MIKRGVRLARVWTFLMPQLFTTLSRQDKFEDHPLPKAWRQQRAVVGHKTKIHHTVRVCNSEACHGSFVFQHVRKFYAVHVVLLLVMQTRSLELYSTEALHAMKCFDRQHDVQATNSDERKPTCEGCQGRREVCEWGVRLNFRPENAQTMDHEHPSMRLGASCHRAQHSFQIVNITNEVIRDYLEETSKSETTNTPVEEAATMVNDRSEAVPVCRPSSSTTTTGDLAATQPSPVPITPTASINHRTSFGSHGTLDPRMPIQAKELFLSPQLSDSTCEDGIFAPGSQYLELHAALRSRIIDTARSTVPSRFGSPDIRAQIDEMTRSNPTSRADDDDEMSRRLAHLSPQQEYVLWENYIYNVAGWLDKFDEKRHFELVLPIMAKSNPHLKYSLLALSARQIERKEQHPDNSCSLALYQHAIHLLSPLLQKRTTAVLASCVVLCVLEMLSCSPKAWRRHLDGCAALIQALGIQGSVGGLEQALFWCFARMDICGSLISSEKTLIPIHRWMIGNDTLEDLAVFDILPGSDMYANRIVYLCGRVVELLCSSGRWEERHQRRSNLLDMLDYTQEWSQLFELIEDWHVQRSEDMKPILTIASPVEDSAKPFPTILFGNGPATSGNQMYHTAALLMLKHKPTNHQLARKPHSMLWHARQICAISISNSHHGCWTNSIQPIWIAGQLMSSPAEHQAILDIYERIGRETGWATQWRADDLREYWGDVND
nr:uncharacterized protein CFP56_11167 [Quercus suber]